MANISEVMQKNFLKVDANDRLVDAISLLQRKDERYAVVFDKRFKPSYRGVLDRYAMVQSKLDPAAKVGSFIMHPPVVSEDEDIFKAAELMYNSYPCVLPIKKKQNIIGVIRSRDLILQLLKMPQVASMTVDNLASKKVVTLSSDARLGTAINVMKENKFSRIPLVDRVGRIVSVFSLTDLFNKHFLSFEGKPKGTSKARGKGQNIGADNKFMLNQKLGDAASKSIITIAPSAKLDEAIREMYKNKISDLVVAENQKPVGIITTRDLLKVFSTAKSPEYWGIQFYGCENLPGQLYDSIREQVAEFYEKINRAFFKDIRYFQVQVKEYEKKKTGHVKYSVHLRLAIPAKVFTADYAHFNLNTAVSWSIDALDSAITRFKEKGKKSWTTTRKKGKRQELGKKEKQEIRMRGKFIRPKLVRR